MLRPGCAVTAALLVLVLAPAPSTAARPARAAAAPPIFAAPIVKPTPDPYHNSNTPALDHAAVSLFDVVFRRASGVIREVTGFAYRTDATGTYIATTAAVIPSPLGSQPFQVVATDAFTSVVAPQVRVDVRSPADARVALLRVPILPVRVVSFVPPVPVSPYDFLAVALPANGGPGRYPYEVLRPAAVQTKLHDSLGPVWIAVPSTFSTRLLLGSALFSLDGDALGMNLVQNTGASTKMLYALSSASVQPVLARLYADMHAVAPAIPTATTTFTATATPIPTATPSPSTAQPSPTATPDDGMSMLIPGDGYTVELATMGDFTLQTDEHGNPAFTVPQTGIELTISTSAAPRHFTQSSMQAAIATLANTLTAAYPYHTLFYEPLTIDHLAGLEGVAACPGGCTFVIDVASNGTRMVTAITSFSFTTDAFDVRAADIMVHSIVLTNKRR
jgi:hypothetical protein